MIPKPTEDTITSLLKEEIERFNVKVEQFPIIDTPEGKRKPDLLCVDAGIYPIEAKFTEKDLIKAIAKVQNDYLKHYKILSIKGGFAILYPDELSEHMSIEVVKDLSLKLNFKAVAMFPHGDNRNFTIYEGRLTDIAEIIAQHILTPPKYVEPNIQYIIKILRESSAYIFSGLKHLADKDLENFFGGKQVFKNILQYEEKEYPLEELKNAVAYLLINQILFYHLLSKLRDEFEEINIDEINRPSDLNLYFKKVLEVNYKTVFSFDVSSLIPSDFTDQIKTAISVIQGLGTEKIGGDLLGTIFHDLIPFDIRKNVAAFYTNVLAAELLAWLSIEENDAKVADFAVGSGGLLVASYKRKKYLLEEEGKKFTERDHKRFVEQELLGTDVMPFAANVAACNLALQSPNFFTNKVRIAVWDATDLKPGKIIPSIAGLKSVLSGQAFIDSFTGLEQETKGVVTLREKSQEEIRLEKYDVIIMNPPFTRQERIPEEYKKILADRFSDYKPINGQLGYYGYFILLADRFLKEGGTMALVLPATVLRVKSCQELRKLWSEKYNIKYIITTSQRSAFSESVRFRETLLVASKSKPEIDTKTSLTVLNKLPSNSSEVKQIVEKIKLSKNDVQDEAITIKIKNYTFFRKSTSNWFKYFAVSDLGLLDIMEDVQKSEKLVLFTFAETKRIDLDDLKFKDFNGFILFDKVRAKKRIDTWIIKEIDGQGVTAKHKNLGFERNIPLEALARGLRRNSYVDKMDVTDSSDYLIQSWFGGLEDMARTTLTNKELEKFDKAVVGQWNKMFNDRKSHVLLARRFDLSAPGTLLLAFYSDIPVIGVDMWCARQLENEYAKVITLWWNSTLNILQILIYRTETRGAWMKIHDYMLNEMFVPDIKKLSESELKSLIEVFNSVKDVKFPSIIIQLREQFYARRKIDIAWLKVMGFKGNIDEFLNKLYSSLADEIEYLKKIMAEGVAEEKES